MRMINRAAAPILLAITAYFALAWGYEGVRLLTSQAYGLDDVWRSQFVFALGRLLSLSPIGLIKLAAFFATLKLAVAAICLAHIVARIRHWPDKANADVLEAALILVIAISIVSVGPAVWSQNIEITREYTIDLVLAGLAAALCLFERKTERPAKPDPLQTPVWFTPWR